MPAHTRPDPTTVVLQFDRDGEEPIREMVIGDGERVLLFAITMLIRRRQLRLHDKLTIRAPTDDDGDIP